MPSSCVTRKRFHCVKRKWERQSRVINPVRKKKSRCTQRSEMPALGIPNSVRNAMVGRRMLQSSRVVIEIAWLQKENIEGKTMLYEIITDTIFVAYGARFRLRMFENHLEKGGRQDDTVGKKKAKKKKNSAFYHGCRSCAWFICCTGYACGRVRTTVQLLRRKKQFLHAAMLAHRALAAPATLTLCVGI